MELIDEIIKYYVLNSEYVFTQFIRHFLISIYGVFFASIIAIPLGCYLARRVKLAQWIISLANIIQTVPTLAMLSIVMLFLGLGVNTVIVSVFLYSLLPIIKNTYTGIRNVDENLLDAAKGMGMMKYQILWRVEIPLALSVIMAGIRNAIVIAIGITTIGTFIGAGGLGDIISRGINVSNGSAIILSGAIPTALMAIIADFAIGIVEKRLDPSRR